MVQKTKSHPEKEAYPRLPSHRREWLKPSSFESQWGLATVQWYGTAKTITILFLAPCSTDIAILKLTWFSVLGWHEPAAGTFLLKQMWTSIISMMKERKRKPSLFSEYVSASWVIHFLLILYFFMCCQWFNTRTHGTLF